MKNKKFKKEQLSLKQCVTHTLKEIRKQDLHEVSKFNNELGRWIRNQCGLWEHGTDRCVADIVTEFKAGRLKSVYLSDNIFTHPELPFDLNNIKRMDVPTDNTLAHPDNCSAVIIEAILQKMGAGDYGRK
jgi:hypothetical protein